MLADAELWDPAPDGLGPADDEEETEEAIVDGVEEDEDEDEAVSYTHLTLPTIYSV